MFKFFAVCLMALFACVAAKPGIVAPLAYSAAYNTYPAYSAYSAYSAPLIASPYTAGYTSYIGSPYAAYSAYPYGALLR